jgi:hypothetical protein
MAVNPVTSGEAHLLRTGRTGQVADLSTCGDATVRGSFLAALISEPLEPPGVIRAVRLSHATITERLDFSGLRIECPVAFDACTFSDAPDLSHGRFLSLGFQACRLPGLHAESLDVQGSLRLEDATFTGKVHLLGARIGGSLYLRRATIASDSEDELAINGSRLSVGGHLACTDATITGRLGLISADVGGVVNLRGTQLIRPGKICLNAERMTVGEGVWFGQKFVARGRLLLNHSEISGGVDLSGSTLLDPETLEESDGAGGGSDYLAGQRVSISGHRVQVARNVVFTKGFRAEGAIALPNAVIEGKLTLRMLVTVAVEKGSISVVSRRRRLTFSSPLPPPESSICVRRVPGY